MSTYRAENTKLNAMLKINRFWIGYLNKYRPSNRLKNRLKQFNVNQLKTGYSTGFETVFYVRCDRGDGV